MALPDKLQQLIQSHANTNTMPPSSEIKSIADEFECPVNGNEIELSHIHAARTRCQSCPGVNECDGWIPVGAVASRRMYLRTKRCAKAISDQRKRWREGMIVSSRMPARLRKMTLKSFKWRAGTDRAERTVREIIAGDTKSLVMTGPPGVGKTHLAAAVANYHLAQGWECLFCTVPELMGDLRASMRDDRGSELTEALSCFPLVIFDDLGAENATGWVAEQLFVALNRRLLDERQTIITTNLSPVELVDHFGGIRGERIVSRLHEDCRWIALSGDDYRLGGS